MTKEEGRASDALETFKKDPDNAATVETKLVRILQDDPDFARELSQIVQSGPIQILTVRRHSRATDTTDSRSYQETLVEEHSRIERTNMAIGSDKAQKHRSRAGKK